MTAPVSKSGFIIHCPQCWLNSPAGNGKLHIIHTRLFIDLSRARKFMDFLWTFLVRLKPNTLSSLSIFPVSLIDLAPSSFLFRCADIIDRTYIKATNFEHTTYCFLHLNYQRKLVNFQTYYGWFLEQFGKMRWKPFLSTTLNFIARYPSLLDDLLCILMSATSAKISFEFIRKPGNVNDTVNSKLFPVTKFK